MGLRLGQDDVGVRPLPGEPPLIIGTQPYIIGPAGLPIRAVQTSAGWVPQIEASWLDRTTAGIANKWLVLAGTSFAVLGVALRRKRRR